MPLCLPLRQQGSGVPILLKDAGQELAGTSHWVGVAALRDAGVTSRRSTALALQLEAAGFDLIGKGACPPPSNWRYDRAAGLRAHT